MIRKYSRARGKDTERGARLSHHMEILPRTRERHLLFATPPRFTGNTPAHAGKTVEAGSTAIKAGKYSRARGKDRIPFKRLRADPEILPRTRERRSCQQYGRLAYGNTPAHAGKTPRYCYVPTDTAGNTPAHAGKTPGLYQATFEIGKYSRARGKDISPPESWVEGKEILPRTRERPTADGDTALTDGNTPAHAGKTHSPSALHAGCRKYSRARGKDSPSNDGCRF